MDDTSPRSKGARALGCLPLGIGLLLCLGVLGSLSAGIQVSGTVEVATVVVLRLLLLALGIWAIVAGIRRLSR